MSERLPPQNPEVSPEASQSSPERQNAEPTATSAEKHPADQLEAIRQNVEAANKHTVIEKAKLESETPSDARPTYVNKELKGVALSRSLKHIRNNLPTGQRLLSKVVHQPVVRRVSAVTAQTVARPSGLLGGGLCAFFGTVLYLYLAKHVGITYNYLLFILFFAGGFVVGLVLEFLLRALASLRSKRS